MISRQLYIDGVEVDLDESLFPYNYQGYNPFFDWELIRVSFVSTLKLPKTPKNIAVFGMLNKVESLSQLYKTSIPARYVQGGIELIPNGTIVVKGITSKYFECSLYTSSYDLYNKLTALLTKLDYTDINGNWGEADVDAARATHADVMPVVVYNGWNIYLFGGDVYVNYNQREVMTSFLLKNVVERMLTQAGYTPSFGTALSASDKWNESILLQGTTKDEAPGTLTPEFKAVSEFKAGASVDTTSGPANVQLDTVIAGSTTPGDYGVWDTTLFRFDVTNADTAVEFLNYTFQGSVKITAIGANCQVSVFVNGVQDAGTIQTILSGATNSWAIGYSIRLKDGDYVEFKALSGAGTRKVWKDSWIRGIVNAYSTVDTVPLYTYFNQYLPRLSQLSLFKEVLFRYGQIPKITGTSVSLKGLEEILADVANVVDWSGKRGSYTDDEISPMLSELAQLNTYKHANEDDALTTYSDAQLNVEQEGKGEFTLDNLNLSASKTTKSSYSNKSKQATIEGIDVAFVDVLPIPVSGSPKYKADSGFRILRYRDNLVTEPNVSFDSVPTLRSDYFVGFYSQSVAGFDRNMSYAAAFEEWYSSFLPRLKNAKWVTRWYNINELDISNLDPHKMLHDSGSYFIFPRVKNYVPGKITKVTMLKI